MKQEELEFYIDTYGKDLYSFCRCVTRSCQEADDLYQDTFALRKAFLSKDAILVNETQESGGYKVTLLGSVAGKSISNFMETNDYGEVLDNRIYTVVAIERADGTPMPDTSSDDYGKEEFYVSHYICGLDPNVYSLMCMGGGNGNRSRNDGRGVCGT